MENGIPNYLKAYVVVQKAPGNVKEEFSVSGKIKCTCQSETFTVMREKLIQSPESKEADKKIQSLLKKYQNKKNDGGHLCITSKHGKDYISHVEFKTGKENLLEDITELRKIAYSGPLTPTFFEAVCSNCGKKILIFHSSKHGYDGIITTSKKEFTDEYKTIKKAKCRKCGKETSKIAVTISSTGKDDLFAEYGDLINDGNWEDAFDWITIDLECSGCDKKTKKYIDLETM